MSAFGKAWGLAFGVAFGTVTGGTPIVPGSPGLVGYPIRLPTHRRNRTRRVRERTDLILIGLK